MPEHPGTQPAPPQPVAQRRLSPCTPNCMAKVSARARLVCLSVAHRPPLALLRVTSSCSTAWCSVWLQAVLIAIRAAPAAPARPQAAPLSMSTSSPCGHKAESKSCNARYWQEANQGEPHFRVPALRSCKGSGHLLLCRLRTLACCMAEHTLKTSRRSTLQPTSY